jgi:hypothetical protein
LEYVWSGIDAAIVQFREGLVFVFGVGDSGVGMEVFSFVHVCKVGVYEVALYMAGMFLLWRRFTWFKNPVVLTSVA